MAILSGDALLVYAFEHIARDTKGVSAERIVKVVIELGRASGADGLVGGQVVDIQSEDKEVRRINKQRSSKSRPEAGQKQGQQQHEGGTEDYVALCTQTAANGLYKCRKSGCDAPVVKGARAHKFYDAAHALNSPDSACMWRAVCVRRWVWRCSSTSTSIRPLRCWRLLLCVVPSWVVQTTQLWRS